MLWAWVAERRPGLLSFRHKPAVPLKGSTLDTGTIIALIAVTFDIVVVVGGGLWAAAKFTTKMARLDETVDRLDTLIDSIESKQANHDTRITVLEDRDERDRSCEAHQPPHNPPPFRPGNKHRRN